MSVESKHQGLRAIIRLEGPHSVDKGRTMEKRQKTDASKLVVFDYCTGGAVYVVSFPPFYNMLKPPKVHEAKESKSYTSMYGNPKIS
jgi:hypothetical protein